MHRTRWALQVSANLAILSTETHTHNLVCPLEHNCGLDDKKYGNSAHLTPAHLRLILNARETFSCAPSVPGRLRGPPSLQLLYLLSFSSCWDSIDFALCPPATPQGTSALGWNAGGAVLVSQTWHVSAGLTIQEPELVLSTSQECWPILLWNLVPLTVS